ncbi:MAG: PLDc_N domain-containing protein [Saprospiraceae bacterium]|nr:PLDc_N domain-containing protein [Saprospiraceae bacterium]
MNLIFGLGPQELIVLALIFLIFLFPVWAIIDIVTSEFKGNDKIIWLLIVLFLPFAGAIIYLLIGRKQKVRISNHSQNTDELV